MSPPGTLSRIVDAGCPERSDQWEDVKMRQRRALEVGCKLLDIVVGFAWEPDDDVRPNRRVGHARADGIHERRIRTIV
jgi:hypothetical protein